VQARRRDVLRIPPQNQNRVVLMVETNYGKRTIQSQNYYNSFSLLKSLEAGFGLPCLNHACDSNVQVMSDLFAGSTRGHESDDRDQG